MRNVFTIIGGTIAALIVMFCIFFTMAWLVSPLDIFGIQDKSTQSQRDFYEQNREQAKKDQQEALIEALKYFNIVGADTP